MKSSPIKLLKTENKDKNLESSQKEMTDSHQFKMTVHFSSEIRGQKEVVHFSCAEGKNCQL